MNTTFAARTRLDADSGYCIDTRLIFIDYEECTIQWYSTIATVCPRRRTLPPTRDQGIRGEMSAHADDDGGGKEGDGEGDADRDAHKNASGQARPSWAFWREAS